MITIYVMDHELLRADSINVENHIVDQHEAETREECEAWFEANYYTNDYSTTYLPPLSTHIHAGDTD